MPPLAGVPNRSPSRAERAPTEKAPNSFGVNRRDYAPAIAALRRPPPLSVLDDPTAPL